MDMAQLESSYPIVFSPRHSDQLTEKYKHVQTSDVVRHFVDCGFEVSDVMRGRRGKTAKFGMHAVRVRPRFETQIKRVGDLYPEVVITNSYDGSSRAQLDLGLFRALCSNGLVVGTSCGMSFSMTHVGSIHDQMDSAVKRMLDYIPQMNEVVEEWSARKLSDTERAEYNRRAAVLRGISGDVNLLTPRRAGDDASTLWGAYNVVQENLIRGGNPYLTKRSRRVKTRGLHAVRRALSLNKDLWDMSAEFLLPA